MSDSEEKDILFLQTPVPMRLNKKLKVKNGKYWVRETFVSNKKWHFQHFNTRNEIRSVIGSITSGKISIFFVELPSVKMLIN